MGTHQRALLNLDEIFAIAEQMEAGAAAFYRRAADLQREDREAAYLRSLSATEEGHLATVRRLRKQAAAAGSKSAMELNQEGGLVEAVIAAGLAVEGTTEATAVLTGEESLEEILAAAVDLERSAVQLYEDLRVMLPNAADRDTLDAILAEERDHADTLTDKLANVE